MNEHHEMQSQIAFQSDFWSFHSMNFKQTIKGCNVKMMAVTAMLLNNLLYKSHLQGFFSMPHCSLLGVYVVGGINTKHCKLKSFPFLRYTRSLQICPLCKTREAIQQSKKDT